MNIQGKELLKGLVDRTVDIHSTHELSKKLQVSKDENRPLRIKLGADPSSSDLHLGHVVVLNKLREFQDAGHTIVFIIGDFTGMIGDPSGQSKTRVSLSKEEVEENAKTYQEQVFKVLNPKQTEIRFNSEWCGSMSFEDVIRLTAHCTVAQILARDDFSKRYTNHQPISLVEFIYPIVQAYDSVMVQADVELGGTDQLFNLLLGRELQKAYGQEPQVVMTLPLLEGLDGIHKMSKSLNNYVGITESPKEIFGKVMSISDELIWRYFSLILCMREDERKEIEQSVVSGTRHPRDIKDELAQNIVAMFYSQTDAQHASQEFAAVFKNKEVPEDIPEVQMSGDPIGILNLLTQTHLTTSNGEARRLVQQGGVSIDEQKVTDPTFQVKLKKGMIIKAGKRKFVKILLK
ncbi:MAG: tyrosine--tRNA ligase [Kiritimatiellae bacterium]|nr:tyrosine--tRNA ligase [Kiritimatiellia bacterium]